MKGGSIMAFTTRYQKTIKGNLVQIGNTLGLSKASNTLAPGTLGSIGAFITTNASLQAPGWPPNTTLNFTQNSSPAQLILPVGASVDYAELIWSASYVVPGGDVTASIGNAIRLVDPLGNVNNLTATGVNITGIGLSEGGENSTNYVKSVNVTSIVAAAGSGTYVCGGVPCTMSASANFTQYAGWSLYVIYRRTLDPVRNIVLFVGQTVSVDVPYAVPVNYPGPPFPIRISYTVGEGDAIITGDQFNTRPGTGVVAVNIGTSIQPPNSNPFASQIMDQNGSLSTFGPFGTSNQNGVAGTNISGGRQGWDIANNIDITSAFTGGAVASLGLDIGTNSDPAIMTANGFVVDLNQPIATLTKSVDKSFPRAGDTYAYTLVYRFTSVPMSTANITLIDTVPNGVTFQSGSVTLNGVGQPTANPNPPGISLGTIQTNTTFTVTYIVKVNTTTTVTTIPNDAYASYAFNSGGTNFINENLSNTVITTIDPFSATLTKSVNPGYAVVGDTIVYTLTIPNNGATLTNVTFTDTIPSNTTFIPDTVRINGLSQAGLSPAPPSGFTLPNLNPNTFTTISFSVKVTTLPVPNPITNTGTLRVNYTLNPSLPNGASQGLNSNIVVTTVNMATLSASKRVSKNYGNIGDLLTYTIVLTNRGNTTATNILFIDTLPQGVSLIAGTFKQDTAPITGTANPPGVTLPNPIVAGGVSTITFQVTVVTLPKPNPIINVAATQYNYTVIPTLVNGGVGTAQTESVTTLINHADLTSATKTVDKAFASCGDTLLYTVLIPNTGSTTAVGVIFKDTIPSGTAFLTGSVTVNGVQQPLDNPQAGITIGTIPSGTTTTVRFVVSVQC